MSVYRLIALDMDGTLIDPENRLPGENIRAVNLALERGTEVVICSGRCMGEIRPYLGHFPRIRYVISENSSCVTDIRTDRLIFCRTLEREVSDRIMDEARQWDVMIQMAAGGIYYMADWTLSRLSRFGMEYYRDLLAETGHFVPDLFSFYREYPGKVTKINLYCANPEDRPRLLHTFRENRLPVNYVSGICNNIEIISPDSGKGEALAELCRYLGIPMRETMAVGDSDNDRTMLRAAGLSVAMGNACEELKAAADCVVADNAHHGAAEAIKTYLLRGEAE